MYLKQAHAVYTSVPNIMKVPQPLFLLPLEEEFKSARDSETKL